MTTDLAQIFEQQTAANREDYYRSQHPKLSQFPECAFELPADLDAQLRAEAEAKGLDYDQMKQDFALSHQIIPTLPEEEVRPLMANQAITTSSLPNYFVGFVSGCLLQAKYEHARKRP